MELFLYWLLRASVLMALFYGLYKFFFANNTFHNANRCSLIFILVMISVLPLFRFNLIPEKKAEPVAGTFSMDFSSIPVTEFVETQPRVEIPWMHILIILFAIGFLFTFIRYLIGLSQIAVIIRNSEKQMLPDHTVLCVTDKNISPFSWMKYIVLSRRELSADNQAVIRHERAHIHLRHSVDMIFFDLFTCIFWFNPFSWLLRREIQSVHEYQADEKVLGQGIDSKQYQLLLIRKSVGEYKFALANNFRQRDLHKRITMMKKDKTNRHVKWNYTMVFPVLFLAMIALSVPKLNAKVVEKENNETDLVREKITVSGQVVDEAGKPIPMVAVVNKVTVTKTESDLKVILEKGEGESDEMIRVRIKGQDDVDETTDDASKVLVSGTVRDKQGVIVGGLVTIKGTNKGTITDLDGNFRIKADIGNTLQFSMINYKTGEYKVESAGKNNLVIVLEPDENGKTADQGVTGSPQNALTVVGVKTTENLQGPVEKVTLRTVGGKHPLYIVDGKTISEAEIQKINAEDIESISVLKNNSAIGMYGNKGKDGVILITTKKSNRDVLSIGTGTMDSLRGDVKNLIKRTQENSSQNLDQILENPPLIIVDGEKMSKDFELNSINPDEIQSMSVLKDKSAIEIYGEEGKNGVIIITKKVSDQNQ